MELLRKLFNGYDAAADAIKPYNLGLAAKYEGDWESSLRHNQKAALLNEEDEATWWNLGIAATALSNWQEARRAWAKCGIELGDGSGEVLWESCTACVRLNPKESGEVVWGSRIDPARIRVLNVPLASSRRRYGDILTCDGTQEGTRISQGQEYPVFNELGLWRKSSHSTYEVELVVPNAEAIEGLKNRCRDGDLWFEDWASVRIICGECSKGNPVEHVCVDEGKREGTYGFAARSESRLRELLQDWLEVEPNAQLKSIRLVVDGLSA